MKKKDLIEIKSICGKHKWKGILFYGLFVLFFLLVCRHIILQIYKLLLWDYTGYSLLYVAALLIFIGESNYLAWQMVHMIKDRKTRRKSIEAERTESDEL